MEPKRSSNLPGAANDARRQLLARFEDAWHNPGPPPRIEEFVKKAAAKPPAKGTGTPPPVVKKQRIIKASDLMKTTYLETPEDVNAFLEALRQELQKALAQGERIQIR